MDFLQLAALSPLRSEIQGLLQHKNFFVFRSVSMHCFCPDYSPKKSARYRDLPPISKQETVSHGHTEKSFKVNFCRYQRKTQLAHICRISSKPYCHCQRVISRRLISRRTGRDSICSRRNHYRSMPVSFSLDTISKEESRYQTPYAARPKRQHFNIYPHFRQQVARCQHSRPVTAGSRCILRNGLRLSGL